MALVSNDSLGMAKTFLRKNFDYGKKARLEQFDSDLRALYGQKCKKGLCEVEADPMGFPAVYELHRNSAILGRLKHLCFQIKSRVGDATIFPQKKGFMGVGKKEGYLEVWQNSTNKESCEKMQLVAGGTLQNPKNSMLRVPYLDKEIPLTKESALDFIKNVLSGKCVSSDKYIHG